MKTTIDEQRDQLRVRKHEIQSQRNEVNAVRNQFYEDFFAQL